MQAEHPSVIRFRAGTHRVVDPEETLARVRRVAPVMGITRVANVTGLDDIGIPVVMVCRPNSRGVSVSQGKGTTLSAAKASGVMESVEAYHAERITHPLMLASFEELRYTRRVVDVDALPHIAGTLYRPNRRLLWIEAADLLGGGSAWVPFELVHADFTLPLPAGSGCFPASTNGLASGNNAVEAHSHALCEVIERDAVSLWNARSADSRDVTRVRLDTVDDAECRSLLERFERADVAVAVWDVTSDVGIAAFSCLIVDRAGRGLRPLYSAGGTGCHPDRAIALSRGLTEAAQSRLTYIAGSRDDMPRRGYVGSQTDRRLAAERAIIDAGPGVADFREVPTWAGSTVDAALAWALDRLAAVGIRQVLSVDLSKPELGLAVVRVVVPGLEGCDDVRTYLPGRRARALAMPL